MRIINILKIIELYYVVLSTMFIAFFIMMTGITVIPIIAEISGEESYTPFFYALSITFGFAYFAYYKIWKLLIKENKK